MRDGMGGDLMSYIPQVLNVPVIRVLMTDVESCTSGAAVWIFPIVRENFGEKFEIFSVHRVVEGDRYHLGDGRRRQITRNRRPVLGTPAIRQMAPLWVAR